MLAAVAFAHACVVADPAEQRRVLLTFEAVQQHLSQRAVKVQLHALDDLAAFVAVAVLICRKATRPFQREERAG